MTHNVVVCRPSSALHVQEREGVEHAGDCKSLHWQRVNTRASERLASIEVAALSPLCLVTRQCRRQRLDEEVDAGIVSTYYACRGRH